MKSFKQIREASAPKGQLVWSGKAAGPGFNVACTITKDNSGFTVVIDGDILDTFKSEKEANKALQTTVKELGGKVK